MSTSLKRTPLYAAHVKAGARICSLARKGRDWRLASGGQLEFRRHLIKERQHQRDATIPHQSHIYALDSLPARSSKAPSQAPTFVE